LSHAVYPEAKVRASGSSGHSYRPKMTHDTGSWAAIIMQYIWGLHGCWEWKGRKTEGRRACISI